MRKRSTRFIGIRDLRQNLSRFLEEARKKNIFFVVMRHGKPISHITPLMEEEAMMHNHAEQSTKRTHADILKRIQAMHLQFDEHDGVAYQRRVRQ